MSDSLPTAMRSKLMSRIRSKNTKPELVVRKLIFAAGYRYRLHVRTLPGSPDLVFPRRKKAVFVHGCFWHQHASCDFARMPKSRVEFWEKKFSDNKKRDQSAIEMLNHAGWAVLVIWECELSDILKLKTRIEKFLER